jgi:Lysozyme like domain
MPGRINGFSLAYAATGGVLLWSGIKGTTLSSTFGGLLQGKAPSGDTEKIGTPEVEETSGTPATGSGTSVPAGSAKYTGTALQKLWTSNGGSQATAAMAEAVAVAESGGSATVTSSNPDGGTNVGIFQLDTKGVGSGHTVAQLQNANLNTQITVMATSNGTNWEEWADPVVDLLPNHRYAPGSPVPASFLG